MNDEPLYPIQKPAISGTSMLEGVAKMLSQIPKDKRHELTFAFETEVKSQTIEARLTYAYRDNLSIDGYVTGSLKGELKLGGNVKWEW